MVDGLCVDGRYWHWSQCTVSLEGHPFAVYVHRWIPLSHDLFHFVQQLKFNLPVFNTVWATNITEMTSSIVRFLITVSSTVTSITRTGASFVTCICAQLSLCIGSGQFMECICICPLSKRRTNALIQDKHTRKETNLYNTYLRIVS